jgi:hypothetical protein
MSERFTINNTAGSLGDWLSLTPILRAKPGSLVIAKNAPHTKIFAEVYKGIADVEFVDHDIANTPESNDDVCFSQRILNHYGITDRNAIPSIEVTQEEKDWAKEFLKDYPNPIAFNPTTASANLDKPYDDICNYRRLPIALVMSIIDTLNSKKYTILKFGTKNTQKNIYNNFEEFEGVVSIPDLSIRQLAACYHVIGRYIGTDTGDHHLMLAVGGECRLFIPPSTWHYNHHRILYFPYAWKDEPIREIYSVFNRPPIKIGELKQ